MYCIFWNAVLFVIPPVECEEPGSVINGRKDKTPPYGVGITVTYTCKSGFKMKESNRLTCQNNGTWDHSTPTCVPCK